MSEVRLLERLRKIVIERLGEVDPEIRELAQFGKLSPTVTRMELILSQYFGAKYTQIFMEPVKRIAKSILVQDIFGESPSLGAILLISREVKKRAEKVMKAKEI